jgi:hypothetical protein
MFTGVLRLGFGNIRRVKTRRYKLARRVKTRRYKLDSAG